ncbi:MAG: hypothetical protein MZU97_20290 [Bacillus subtilis]|nr:hypothetical protein [Bacillus subtilis]
MDAIAIEKRIRQGNPPIFLWQYGGRPDGSCRKRFGVASRLPPNMASRSKAISFRADAHGLGPRKSSHAVGFGRSARVRKRKRRRRRVVRDVLDVAEHFNNKTQREPQSSSRFIF